MLSTNPIGSVGGVLERGRPNVSCGIANGQDLPFPSGAFDAVICSLGLMLFPDPSQAMAEFRRVLRDDGRAAVAVETTAENSLTTRVNAAIGRHIPSRAAAAAVYYSLGEASLIRALFETAEFTDVEVFAEAQHFPFPSFNAYFHQCAQ